MASAHGPSACAGKKVWITQKILGKRCVCKKNQDPATNKNSQEFKFS